jgi:hypothetical protein
MKLDTWGWNKNNKCIYIFKRSCRRALLAWNPCTKTTIFKTRPPCCRLGPDWLFTAAELGSVTESRESIMSKCLKYEFSLVLRRGAFITRSTITIGIFEGFPNMCMSWIERLLICMKQYKVMELQLYWEQGRESNPYKNNYSHSSVKCFAYDAQHA